MTALNDFSILLLLAHFLGDYQLQWDALAKEKAHNSMAALDFEYLIDWIVDQTQY